LKKKGIAEITRRAIAELHNKKRRQRLRYPKNNKSITRAGIVKNLLRISIESSIEDAKTGKEGKEEEIEIIPVEKEDELNINGGYGTVSKSTGYAPQIIYANYDRIWSNLGAFKSKSMFENSNSFQSSNNEKTETTRQMVETETIEKAEKHFKYFVLGDSVGDVGFTPPVGIGVNSKEWEKYRMMTMMSVYRPLLALKRQSA
jgi:hypothetical protein